MKYDQDALPLGSIERAIAQLKKNDLNKAVKTCRKGNIPLDRLKSEFQEAFDRLFAKGTAGPILSIYYTEGSIGTYTVRQLLAKLCEKRDYPTFLKQTHRFGIYEGLEESIQEALSWHEQRGLPDAFAWKVKFQRLFQTHQLKEKPESKSIHLISEEESIQAGHTVTLELRRIATQEKKSQKLTDESSAAESPTFFPRFHEEKWSARTRSILKLFDFSLLITQSMESNYPKLSSSTPSASSGESRSFLK